MEIVKLIGAFLTLSGSVFFFLSCLGLVRMPDVYNRMQAGTKSTTLGSILFLFGLGLANTAWLPKFILLILFIIFTNPISSHALARASHFINIKLTDKSVKDDLKNDSSINDEGKNDG